MKYFLTGGTGFIGGRIAKQLRAEGHEVVALVRHPSKARSLERAGVKLHVGDIADQESIRGAMEGCDGLFHTAGWYKLDAKNRSDAMRVNVNGTRNVLEEMQAAGVRKGVYTSTVAVYSDTRGELVDESCYYDGKHLTEYDRTKWLAHYEVAEPMIRDGLPLIIVLPGVVYGPGDASPVHETLVQYLQKKLPLTPRRTAYCWSHVDDVAEGHRLAMDKGKIGENYILAGHRHTLFEALQIAQQLTGIAPPGCRLSPPILHLLASVSRFAGAVWPLPAELGYERLRTIAGVTYLGDNAKARRELGYNPRPLIDGFRETLDYEQQNLR